MTLVEWLSTQPRGAQSALARAIGVTPGHITDLRNRKCSPSMRVARAIARATDGAVMPNDFLQPGPWEAA